MKNRSSHTKSKSRLGSALLLGTAISISLGVALPAHAQDADEDESEARLRTVMVTAQKREQSINDIGITLNAFDADALEGFGVESADDLEQLVPGLTVTNAQPSGVPVFTIRGVGFADFAAGSSSTVGIYRDEVAVPYTVMSGNLLYDIERVEVLKGPQGDLYGRNTTAGQINFISNKPTEEFAAGIGIGYSSFETVDLEGFVSGSLSDSVRGRLSGKYVNSGEGWQESLSRPGDKLGERDELALRGQLEFDLSETVEALLQVNYFKNDSENIAATPLTDGAGGLFPVITSTDDSQAADWTAGNPPRNDNETIGISARISADLSPGLSLTSITAYDTFERADLYDTSGVAVVDADSFNQTEIDVFSQEFRLEKTDIENLYLLGGLYYSTDTVDENYLLDNGGGVLGLTLGLGELNTRYEQDTTSAAVFGHAEYDLSEKLRFTAGVRYTSEEREWTGCTFDSGDGTLAGLWNNILTPFVVGPQGFTPGALAPGACGIFDDIAGSPTFGTFPDSFSDETDTSRWSGRVTLDYKPVENVLLYGTISNAFKSGGFNGAAVQTTQGYLPYEPEELTAFELGLKSTLLNERLQLNAATFFYDYEDKQQGTVAVTPVGNIVVQITNVPKSEIFGAEVEGSWLLTDNLTWDFGLTYLDSEITEYQQVDPINSVFPNVVTFDASGNALDNAPELQGSSTLTYRQSLTENYGLLVAGDVSYKDDSVTVNQNIEGYTLLNARIGLENYNGWSVLLWGRNITDEYYYHSETTSNCCVVRLNGQPATYGISFSRAF